jgi:hypothetical protein
MTSFFRKAYSVVGLLLLLEFLTQFYVMAAAIFTIAAKADPTSPAAVVKTAVNNADGFAGIHAVNGTLVIPITILVLIGLSFGARYPWRTTGLTALLFVLLLIQLGLAFAGFGGFAAVAGLHGVNALILTGLGIYLLARNWAFRRQVVPAATVPAAEVAARPAEQS